jgi:hypothetical protein
VPLQILQVLAKQPMPEALAQQEPLVGLLTAVRVVQVVALCLQVVVVAQAVLQRSPVRLRAVLVTLVHQVHSQIRPAVVVVQVLAPADQTVQVVQASNGWTAIIMPVVVVQAIIKVLLAMVLHPAVSAAVVLAKVVQVLQIPEVVEVVEVVAVAREVVVWLF